jgi:hypothetical protein
VTVEIFEGVRPEGAIVASVTARQAHVHGDRDPDERSRKRPR